MSGKYIEITSKEDFSEKVLQANLPVLVDFWAPWCGPCRMVGPILEELAQTYEGKIVVAKVNTDENSDLAYEYSIMSIPTIMMFKNGKMADKMIGALPKDELVKFIDQHTKAQ
ncbi:MAG TPA: thioredoxin [Caldisericia bacterium]|nr:thioredoxin [Caldisericia bacterium]